MNRFDNLKSYTVKKGDTLYNIALTTGVNIDTLQKINGLDSDDYIYAGESILIPNSNMDVYIVEDNETITEVAKKLNVSTSQLVDINRNIFLLPGQLLFFKKNEIYENDFPFFFLYYIIFIGYKI